MPRLAIIILFIFAEQMSMELRPKPRLLRKAALPRSYVTNTMHFTLIFTNGSISDLTTSAERLPTLKLRLHRRSLWISTRAAFWLRNL